MAGDIVGMEEFPEDLPDFIEDYARYVPQNLPPADLIIAVGLSGAHQHGGTRGGP